MISEIRETFAEIGTPLLKRNGCTNKTRVTPKANDSREGVAKGERQHEEAL